MNERNDPPSTRRSWQSMATCLIIQVKPVVVILSFIRDSSAQRSPRVIPERPRMAADVLAPEEYGGSVITPSTRPKVGSISRLSPQYRTASPMVSILTPASQNKKPRPTTQHPERCSTRAIDQGYKSQFLLTGVDAVEWLQSRPSPRDCQLLVAFLPRPG